MGKSHATNLKNLELRLPRYLLAEKCYDTIDLYEQQDHFGGVWNYSTEEKAGEVPVPQTDPHGPSEHPKRTKSPDANDGSASPPVFSTPMYDGLETNIPHELMEHSDHFTLQKHQLFPRWESVLDYLEQYASDVEHLVKFHTQVLDIRSSDRCGEMVWYVSSEDLVLGSKCRGEYDAVVVSNGHYNVPKIPNITGIESWHKVNPGIISHSKSFRNSLSFKGKKTMIVGFSASGLDITWQLLNAASLPILVSQKSQTPLEAPFSGVRHVAEIVEFLPPSYAKRAVRLADDTVEDEIDAVLFCTGYLYSFPFLNSVQPPLISTGERVQRLYKHIFRIDQPTLAFVGLPARIIPFRTFESQAAVIAKVWSSRLDLPSLQDMEQWESSGLKERGNGKAFHVLPFPQDFDYRNELVSWASQAPQLAEGKLPSKWAKQDYWVRERIPCIKKAFIAKGEDRRAIRTIGDAGFKYSE